MEVISRKEAKAAGMKSYFTGAPCNLGGVAVRTVVDKKCQCDAHLQARALNAHNRYMLNRDYRRSKQRSYYLENQGACADYSKKHYLANRDKYIRQSVEWQQNNREQYRERCRNWARRNPHRTAVHVRNRQARKANATPSWFSEFDDLVIREAYELAEKRGEVTGFPWEVDHIIPIAGENVCGLHVAGNIQVIPRFLNRRKSNRFEASTEEFE